MQKALKILYRKFTNWGLAFPPFGFLFFNSLNIADRAVTFFYCRKKIVNVEHSNCSISVLQQPQILDLVTIAFNNAEVIKWQVESVKKNLMGSHIHTVIDNSSDGVASESIEQICKDRGIGYIRLPKNPYNGKFPSWSHGLALNWAYNNYILPRGAKYFGFLDHDIFPYKPLSISSILEKYPIYGTMQNRAPIWYLWPGFCFFRANVFAGKKVNFSSTASASPLSITLMDTGGGNWKSVYSKMVKQNVKEAVHHYAFLLGNGEISADGKPYNWVGDLQALKSQYDTNRLGENKKFIEFIDGWLHIRRMGYSNSEETRLKLKALMEFLSKNQA